MVGMNPKRQRRPNVRLGEIGDVSAAVLCGTSQRPIENWEETRWRAKPGSLKDLVRQRSLGFSSEIAKSRGPSSLNRRKLMRGEGEVAAPGLEQQSNAFDRGTGADKGAGQGERKRSFELGPIVKKISHAKLRGGEYRGDRVWKSVLLSVNTTSDIGKCQGKDGFEVHCAGDTYNGHEQLKDYDFDLTIAPKDLSPDAVVVNFDRSLSPHIEDDWVDPLSDGQAQMDAVEYNNDNCEDNNEELPPVTNSMGLPYDGTSRLKNDAGGILWDQTGSVKMIMPFTERVSCIVLDSVTQWLEELGFSKYAHIFEIHEVDKEVLPLLTFEDLKEMGINAVGPRRKIYRAIQLLKEGFSA